MSDLPTVHFAEFLPADSHSNIFHLVAATAVACSCPSFLIVGSSGSSKRRTWHYLTSAPRQDRWLLSGQTDGSRDGGQSRTTVKDHIFQISRRSLLAHPATVRCPARDRARPLHPVDIQPYSILIGSGCEEKVIEVDWLLNSGARGKACRNAVCHAEGIEQNYAAVLFF